MKISVKNRKFSPPHVFCTPVKGLPWELGISARGQKLESWGYWAENKVWPFGYNTSTWWTDGQTPGAIKDRAYAHRCAVKISYSNRANGRFWCTVGWLGRSHGPYRHMTPERQTSETVEHNDDEDNNNNNTRIYIVPYGRNFRGYAANELWWLEIASSVTITSTSGSSTLDLDRIITSKATQI